MSRYYGMEVVVRGFEEAKRPAINNALEDLWDFTEDWVDGDDGWRWYGESNLGGGMGEIEFAEMVRDAVWKAHKTPCEIEVRCSYLEDPPTEYYTFDEDDYQEWLEAQCPMKTA